MDGIYAQDKDAKQAKSAIVSIIRCVTAFYLKSTTRHVSANAKSYSLAKMLKELFVNCLLLLMFET